MATLSGRYPASTFGNILQVDNSNSGLDTTLRNLEDGKGNTAPMQIATNYINITALKYNGHIVALAGALTTAAAVVFSGAYAFTATLTGVTGVTFPTTGTLSTLAGSETLTNKTLTAPVIATITNTGTLTLPTSTDTLVGRATTDTLTNKTLTSPTLVTPALGTPASGTLTNTTGFPVANLAGAGTGVLTFLATPSSANLRAALTDETGSGAAVFATSPTLTTPTLTSPTMTDPSLGVATGTSFNGITGVASASDQELGTSAVTVVTPSVQQRHPSACKGWVLGTFIGTATTSYNVSSVTDNGAGNATVNWNTDMSSANYCALANIILTPGGTAGTSISPHIANTMTAGSTQIYSIVLNTFAGADGNAFTCAVFGDQ